MNFENALLFGVANDLADNPNARVKLWSENDANGNPGSPQPAGSTAIVFRIWPEDMDSVTLAPYTVSDDPSLSDSVQGLQVTIRCADMQKVGDIADDVFSRLHGRQAGMLGNVRLVQSFRRSGVDLGQDGNGRIGRTDNYYLTVHRPTEHRQ